MRECRGSAREFGAVVETGEFRRSGRYGHEEKKKPKEEMGCVMDTGVKEA